MPLSGQRLIREVLRRMALKGWSVLLWETHRSFARAQELHKRGTGSADSVHCYFGAFDIVDGDQYNVGMDDVPENPWQAPPEFWADLEDIEESLGIVRLYKRGKKHEAGDKDAESWDKPHGQFCTVADQAMYKRMTMDQREAYIQKRFASVLATIP